MKPVRIILDFEASAMDGGYPIEVGVAKTWPNGRITASSRLIRHDIWLQQGLWDDAAQKIHTITKENIVSKGFPIKTVARWLNQAIGTGTAYCDGARDPDWLKTLFQEAGMAPSFELHNIEEVFDAAVEVDQESMTTIMNNPAHRAAADAVQISNMLQRCLKFG